MQHEHIELIQDWHRKRRAAMDMRKRIDLALGANLRLWLGWRRDLPTEESDRIKQLAADLIDCGEKLAKSKKHELAESEEYLSFGAFIRMTIDARKPTDEFEAIATKKLEQLALELPAWSAFGKGIKGFGPVSLASIIGETGDLSGYETHSKLWRRMGMAPFAKDGVTRSGQQWKMKGGLAAEDWTAFGYNGRRRSIMFVIEDVLIKNTDHYYRVYIERKEALCRRALIEGKLVVPAAKIPKGSADGFISQGQVAAQAKHYMGKRLLRDLWQAWRRATSGVPEMAVLVLPASESGEAGQPLRNGATVSLPPQQHASVDAPKTAPGRVRAAKAKAGKAVAVVRASAKHRAPSRRRGQPDGASNGRGEPAR